MDAQLKLQKSISPLPECGNSIGTKRNAGLLTNPDGLPVDQPDAVTMEVIHGGPIT